MTSFQIQQYKLFYIVCSNQHLLLTHLNCCA